VRVHRWDRLLYFFSESGTLLLNSLFIFRAVFRASVSRVDNRTELVCNLVCLELSAAMENNTGSTPYLERTIPNQDGPSRYVFEQSGSNQMEDVRSVYRADEKRPATLSYYETQVNSTATSIHHDKEGAELERGVAIGHDHVDIFDPNRPKIKLRQRLHHFTWAWYTFPMSTGGLSLLIFAQPHQFTGLRQIGLFVYIVNIIIFSCITIAMITRFLLHRGDFLQSLTHPREGFFFPTFFLAVATLITSTQRYAIPADDVALTWAIQTAYWGYVVLTLALAVGQYSYVFAAHSFALTTMMPTWILPIFPVMLSGTIASVIADTQPAIAAVPVVVGGMTCQGLGMAVSLLMYSHMVGRLMQAGKSSNRGSDPNDIVLVLMNIRSTES
jgi:hypothetical protein